MTLGKYVMIELVTADPEIFAAKNVCGSEGKIIFAT